MKLRILAIVLALCGLLAALTACGGAGDKDPIPTLPNSLTSPNGAGSDLTPWKAGDKHPTVTITMEDGGVIKAVLYPDKAPNTVHNFISLANSGFYEGKIFHRVIPGFMIQGGCIDGTGSGRTGFSIPCETRQNGFMANNISHVRGVLSMAHAGVDTGSTQFFIIQGTGTHLDGVHTAFGAVTEGMDVVDRIVNVATGANDRPLAPPTIKSVVAETYGVAYPEPVTIPGY